MEYTGKTGHSAMYLVMAAAKTQAHLLLGEIEKAKESFTEVENLIKKHKIIKIYYCPYLLAKVQLEFALLKEMGKPDRQFRKQLRKTQKTSKKLITNSRKMMGSMSEALIIRGKIYHYLRKGSKAVKYFAKAIENGEKLNGRLELSRAFFEMGKCLLDPDIKQNRYNSLSGDDYLKKAKTMFEEMKLEWDLGEYEDFLRSREI
jgi:tetratricopeptide (TPR) repeat protein